MTKDSSTHPSQIEVAKIEDQIHNLLREGLSMKEIAARLNMPLRTCYEYAARLRDEIIAVQSARRREDMLQDIQMAIERYGFVLRKAKEIIEDPKATNRSRNDALVVYMEATTRLVSIDAENTKYIYALNNTQDKTLRYAKEME